MRPQALRPLAQAPLGVDDQQLVVLALAQQDRGSQRAVPGTWLNSSPLRNSRSENGCNSQPTSVVAPVRCARPNARRPSTPIASGCAREDHWRSRRLT
ncbi:hypothetical protein Ddc_23894 [Ditylenchus destructor]|nr:hypothetical protein Ddc_23894 [Ditylenchus destructor]